MIYIIHRPPEEQGCPPTSLKKRLIRLPHGFCSSSHVNVLSIRFSVYSLIIMLIKHCKTTTTVDRLLHQNF